MHCGSGGLRRGAIVARRKGMRFPAIRGTGSRRGMLRRSCLSSGRSCWGVGRGILRLVATDSGDIANPIVIARGHRPYDDDVVDSASFRRHIELTRCDTRRRSGQSLRTRESIRESFRARSERAMAQFPNQGANVDDRRNNALTSRCRPTARRYQYAHRSVCIMSTVLSAG